jgi:hypothetical protein
METLRSIALASERAETDLLEMKAIIQERSRVDGPARRGSVQFLVSTFFAYIITDEISGRHDRAIRFKCLSPRACTRAKRMVERKGSYDEFNLFMTALDFVL